MDARWMLRLARARAGLSQREVAQRAGLPQSTVARIERGHIDPRARTLDRLLRACGLELAMAEAQEDLAGVDRSLIQDQLALSPTERVAGMARAMEFAEQVHARRRAAAG